MSEKSFEFTTSITPKYIFFLFKLVLFIIYNFLKLILERGREVGKEREIEETSMYERNINPLSPMHGNLGHVP